MKRQNFYFLFQFLKQTSSRLKPYLRWAILGSTIFFLAKTLKDRAGEVASLEITGASWILLSLSLGVTLLAHIWSGWVWIWILREFKQSVPASWAMRVYLKTNIAKYLPGNVWHFYGRVLAVSQKGASLSIAALSVLLEPLLMAAAASILALIGTLMGTLRSEQAIAIWQLIGLAIVLTGIHPRFLNPVVKFLANRKLKNKTAPDIPEKELKQKDAGEASPEVALLDRYPILPLLGEMGFLLFRGSGFLLAIAAMNPPADTLEITALPMVFAAFSFAWLLGLVVPGAPGGIGVFEATAIALLDNHFSTGVLLGAIAFYRLISILAEVVGAGLALL
ncbi:MAG: UPF0104 family protein [Oscillatoria sp. SIO1A7]|nr:UPF0104 family protein [Oscillatoria sp. SIO1A7]